MNPNKIDSKTKRSSSDNEESSLELYEIEKEQVNLRNMTKTKKSKQRSANRRAKEERNHW